PSQRSDPPRTHTHLHTHTHTHTHTPTPTPGCMLTQQHGGSNEPTQITSRVLPTVRRRIGYCLHTLAIGEWLHTLHNTRHTHTLTHTQTHTHTHKQTKTHTHTL